MKIEQLIEILRSYNPSAEVLIGNQETEEFKKISSEFSMGNYMIENGEVEFGLDYLDDHLKMMGFTEEDVVVGDAAFVIYME